MMPARNGFPYESARKAAPPAEFARVADFQTSWFYRHLIGKFTS
ncbi:hypothetical protein L13192_02781 [Pyrenophora tritici-repentis]|uniref:Uncharacterized protein n=1 Tax=Pyrenophora tritici-repentis TaxID=45151 RepID=A0A922T2Y8_9PLEO|nr:hypothetical protein Ptr86124_001466 [Pyrenophora tritici-repentis]KAI1671922.1 hypothetical protein L13192_02781 [Pyrenophora tritici-repentis]KAI1685920.1 hypothetical protein KJE20_03885 [Pyrenophora tritici-repentis]